MENTFEKWHYIFTCSHITANTEYIFPSILSQVKNCKLYIYVYIKVLVIL